MNFQMERFGLRRNSARLAVIALSIYVILGVYFFLNRMVIDVGVNDPVYKLTGLARTDQVILVTIGLIATFLFTVIPRSSDSLDFTSSRRRMNSVFLLFVLVSVNFLAASAPAVFTGLQNQFWPFLFAWIGAVLIVQGLLVRFALGWLRSPWIQLGILAGLCLLNLIALYLALTEVFIKQKDLPQIAILAVSFLGLWALFGVVGRHVVPVGKVNTVLAITLLAPAVVTLSANSPRQVPGDLTPFGEIRFRYAPNIHIVTLDFLSPAVLTEKHMGLTSLPYSRLLDREGVLVYKNAFASWVPTAASLDSLLRFANPEFDDGARGYFSGQADSPVTHVFHNNGYKISTGFRLAHLGQAGPFVDSYYPQNRIPWRGSSLCALMRPWPITFFGFCAVVTLFTESISNAGWHEYVEGILRDASPGPDAAPELTLHHIYRPIGHVATGFRMDDLEARSRYIEVYRNQAADAVDVMRRLQEIVAGHQRPSMLIMMGDHGTLMSRNAGLDDDPTFHVQGQHGIQAAVLVNGTDCTAEQLRHYSSVFATPARILAAVVRCLASEPEAIDSAMNFVEAFALDEFLYE